MIDVLRIGCRAIKLHQITVTDIKNLSSPVEEQREEWLFSPRPPTLPRILRILTHHLICWDAFCHQGIPICPLSHWLELILLGFGKKLTNGHLEAFRGGGYHVTCQGNCRDLHFMPSSSSQYHISHVDCLATCFAAWDITIGHCHEMAEAGEGLA